MNANSDKATTASAVNTAETARPVSTIACGSRGTRNVSTASFVVVRSSIG